jgi:hypothetical protein
MKPSVAPFAPDGRSIIRTPRGYGAVLKDR